MISREELERCVDEGLMSELECSLKLNLQRIDLLREIARMQKRLLSEQRRIGLLELKLAERRFYFNAALRDLDRLEAVEI